VSDEASTASRLGVRSGGQTGVDRAALDAAISSGRPYGGWCPKGGWAEDLTIPPGLLVRYPNLLETTSDLPEDRTAWNVRDSCATLVLVPGSIGNSQGTKLTIEWTARYERPCFIIDYRSDDADAEIMTMLSRFKGERSLNVAGPRESEAPGAYDACRRRLLRAFSSV
jgi:hypothetical protein